MKRTFFLLILIVLIFVVSSCNKKDKPLLDQNGDSSSLPQSSQADADSSSLPQSSQADADISPSRVESSSSKSISSSKSLSYTIVDDVLEWNLRLVNKDYRVSKNFSISTAKVADKLVDTRIEKKLNQLIDAAKSDKIYLSLVSGYRTYDYQNNLFNKKVESYISQGFSKAVAEQKAGEYVAPPGGSEHNIGLAVDIVSSDWFNKNTNLNEGFADTKEFKWLNENAHKFGFIMRYQKGKEDITKYAYEPWHYRYVGEKAAAEIKQQNCTLEEYLKK